MLQPMHQIVVNKLLLKSNKSIVSAINKNIKFVNYMNYRSFKSKSGKKQDEATQKRLSDEMKKESNMADAITKFLVEAIGVQRIKLEWTEEEYEIVRIYNSKSSHRDFQEQKDLTTKIYLQQQAIQNIPTEFLRKAAEEKHETEPPERRDAPGDHYPPPWSPYSKLLIQDQEVLKKYHEDQKRKKEETEIEEKKE